MLPGPGSLPLALPRLCSLSGRWLDRWRPRGGEPLWRLLRRCVYLYICPHSSLSKMNNQGEEYEAQNTKVDRPNSVHPLIRSTPHLRPPPVSARPAPCNGRGGIARSHSWRTCRRDINGRERGPGAEADLRSGGVLFWALQIIPSRTKVAHGFVTSRSYRNGRGGISRRVIPTHAVEAARPMRAGWGRKGLLHG